MASHPYFSATCGRRGPGMWEASTRRRGGSVAARPRGRRPILEPLAGITRDGDLIVTIDSTHVRVPRLQRR